MSKLDRISRNDYTRAKAYRTLRRTHIPITAGRERYDLNNASDKLHVDIMMVFAEYEAKLITERMSGGRERLRAEGGMPHPHSKSSFIPCDGCMTFFSAGHPSLKSPSIC